MITIETAQKVLNVVDAGLCFGLGKPIPGQMCIEAAVCFALGESHTDRPSCVADSVRTFKICLNDSDWSFPAARASGLRKLAVAQLGSQGTIDEVLFCRALVKLTIQRVLPPVLRAAGLNEAADLCESEGTEAAARVAHAAYAGSADYADYAGSAGSAGSADYASAAYAAAYAARAASRSDDPNTAAYAAAFSARTASATAYTFARAAARAACYADDARDGVLVMSASCCLDALRSVNAPGIALLKKLGLDN